MNDSILSSEQWIELWGAIDLFDQNRDRTVLNRVLVSIMKNLVESLDDESQVMDEDNMERQLVITLIESELAEMIAVNACPSWCCRRGRIQPSNQNNHKFSDYLINIARAKSLDQDKDGYIPKEIIERIFREQLSNEKMAELMQFVDTDNNGNINYKDYATLMLIIVKLQ